MTVTLRKSLHRQALMVLGSIMLLLVMFLGLFYIVQNSQRQEDAIERISSSADRQINQLLPGLLIPEQKAGLDLVLERIRISEDLENIVLLPSFDMPENYSTKPSRCTDHGKQTICKSMFSNRIAVATRIQESGQDFGLLLKEKKVETFALSSIWLVIWVSSLSMILLFLGFLWIVTKATRVEIPNAIQTLLKNLENGLKRRDSSGVTSPEHAGSEVLRYEEFQQLALGIEQILKAHENARLKATLADIAVGIAHDIRAPLAAIRTAVGTSEEIPINLKGVVSGASRRLQQIADDLLRQAGILSKKSADSPSSLAVLPMLKIDCFHAALINLVEEKNVALRENPEMTISLIAEESAGSFLGIVDEVADQLVRALSNLLDNSVQAISQSSGRVELRYSLRNGWLYCTVSDNGKGIPAEILPRLGREGETHGKIGGTGFGLYFAKTTCENAGGKLEIESQPGEGTTVTLKVPIAENASQYDAVLVDDDVWILEAWELSARKKGLRLLTLQSAEQLEQKLALLPRSIPLFIDSSLGDDNCRRGEDVVPALSAMGFNSIYMHSGHEAAQFSNLGSMVKIIPKGEPDWSLLH